MKTGEQSVSSVSSAPSRSAFSVLMSRASEVFLPEKVSARDIETLRGDQLLRNDLIDVLDALKVGWSPDTVKTVGELCVKCLTAALWLLHPHYHSFQNRSIVIPEPFASFRGYNDWQRKKQKKPRLTQKDLQESISQLSDMLMQPWITHKRYGELKNAVSKLVDCMDKHRCYLEGHNVQMQQHHQQQKPVSALDDSVHVLIMLRWR